MNPGRSGAVIGSFPSDCANAMVVSIGLVARRQRADHLDQLHQRHRVEEVKPAEAVRPRVAAASSVMQSDEVFDSKIGALHPREPRRPRMCRFASRVLDDGFDDEIARPRSSTVVVPLRFASVLSRVSVVSLPRVTPSSRNERIRPSPFCSVAASTSRTIVE